jgi:hypothetical protein
MSFNNEALVQCLWPRCGHVEARRFGIGRPDEIRCSRCGSRVEILTVNGVNQPSRPESLPVGQRQ